MRKILAAAVVPMFLCACGGDTTNDPGNGLSDKTSAAPTNPSAPMPNGDTLTLRGQVTDGPVSGAQVCLHRDGNAIQDTAGKPVCSDVTDSQGNYSLAIPRNLPDGLLMLVATKANSLKLASILGENAQVLDIAAKAEKQGIVDTATFPSLVVSHLSTANIVLADTNADGKLAKEELATYAADYTKMRTVAALVKAVVDFGQANTLLGGSINDTLALAHAAAAGRPFGSANQSIAQWSADPANARIIAAVDLDIAGKAAGSLSNYRLATTVTSHAIPSPVMVSNQGGNGNLSCEINTSNESVIVQIGFDTTSGVIVLKHDGRQTIGSYNPANGSFNLTENDPLEVSTVSPSGVTYYAEGRFNMSGSVDAATGKITGSFSESSINTWSLDSTRQVCTASGSITATRQ